MLGFANIYSIYLSVYQLLICYFLLKTQDVIITKFDEEPFLLPDYTRANTKLRQLAHTAER